MPLPASARQTNNTTCCCAGGDGEAGGKLSRSPGLLWLRLQVCVPAPGATYCPPSGARARKGQRERVAVGGRRQEQANRHTNAALAPASRRVSQIRLPPPADPPKLRPSTRMAVLASARPRQQGRPPRCMPFCSGHPQSPLRFVLLHTRPPFSRRTLSLLAVSCRLVILSNPVTLFCVLCSSRSFAFHPKPLTSIFFRS